MTLRGFSGLERVGRVAPASPKSKVNMDLNEMGGPYLRLKQESRQIKTELAAGFASLRELAKRFRANADLIDKDPALWDVDTDLFAEEIQQAGVTVNRYRELLWSDAGNQAAIDRYESAW